MWLGACNSICDWKGQKNAPAGRQIRRG